MDRRPVPTMKLRNWRRGDALSAAHLDEAVVALQRLHGSVDGPQQVYGKQNVESVTVQMFKVREIGSDWVICETHRGRYDAAGDDDYVRVAKPYLLRQTPFDGTDANGTAKTRNGLTFEYSDGSTRTVTDSDGYTEEQVIVPGYVEGDIIYAARGMLGGTGVLWTVNGEDYRVEWVDLNVDGRSWGAA